MAKIRPQTFVAGLSGKAMPMNKLGAKGFYIQSVGGRWWVKKGGAIVANLPFTIESPHKGQIETRVRFGEIAQKTRGMPLAQRLEIISREMTGYRAPSRMNPEEYPSRSGGYHTLEELKRMLGEGGYGGGYSGF